VQGQLTLGRNAQAVSGRAWLDHEWSSTLLDERASGWDWIGLNFDDGSALTAFRIRTSGGETLWSHASLVDANNRRVSEGEARFTAQRVWTSARSQGVYPVVCEVQCAGRSFLLTPLFEDQEIDARASTGGFYWEGAVTAKVAGVQVGRGYMELTGYAGRVRL
jgi:predicted secreted hydrolase